MSRFSSRTMIQNPPPRRQISGSTINVQVLDWPAQSPDLNTIEHLWEHLKHQLQQYDTPPKGVHKLWDRVVEEWNEIPPEVCQRLIESMPRRIEAVIRVNGGHTKY